MECNTAGGINENSQLSWERGLFFHTGLEYWEWLEKTTKKVDGLSYNGHDCTTETRLEIDCHGENLFR